MSPPQSLLIALAVLFASSPVSFPADFSSIGEAIAVLQDEENENWDRERMAAEYLLKNQKTSLPLLKEILRKQGKGWLECSYVLRDSKDPGAVALFIQILGDNLFLKEADGSRMQFGYSSKNGCELRTSFLGQVMAGHLGSIGDKRAIPVLRQAMEQGDSEVSAHAHEALYQMGEITIDQIFKAATDSENPTTKMPEILMGIIHGKHHDDPKGAIALYDRVIASFPEDSYEVASAHYWKIQCYQLLKEFDLALKQCDILLERVHFKNLTEQAPQLRAETLDLARQQKASQPAPKP